ncbi:apolipoprotein N-acyltransferase [Helicobacter sp. 12S02232-10]|uniref:apolipoprotein N-acyltransferase n=1 Tax=Helicobacter sp. 12S02232-10 TaxID=1476197 RepID=UPI000BA58BCC|nr:apolipoprotein N-acyltransferase [Helicobacter sp. 12S02232-10]PAF47979.1 apolipoprotein N-acyltransferase [Helicobacter sp. 12S02232-10]
MGLKTLFSFKILGIYLLSSFVLAAIFLIPVYGSALFFYKDWKIGLIIYESIFALLSIGVWFGVPKKLGFWFGFFVGLGLFYWTGLSFRYSPSVFLIPFVMVFVGLVYGIIFYFLLFFNSPFYRIFTLMVMSYIHPFGFDWLVIDSFFSYSVFGVDKLSFFCIVSGVWALIYFKRVYKIFGVCFLLLALDWGGISGKSVLPLKMAVTTTYVNQDSKWESENIQNIIRQNLNLIQKAILDGKDIVILPETAFPFALNESYLMEELENLSREIAIVVGALRKEKQKVYNSAYLFENGNFTYADKVVLAPFGEKIPFPDFIARPLYKYFFGEGYGLSQGKTFEEFQIGKSLFASAICYEGTSKITYEKRPQYLILISNNGWFVPSIEPFLQRILIKYYARIYDTTIIHSINQSPSYIVSPFVLGDENL